MDQVVIDSSVIMKWFVVEDHTAEALQIRVRYNADELLLLAPDVINAEVGNIVWKKHNRGELPTSDAQAIIADFLIVELELTPTSGLLNEAYQLAIAYKRTVYDSMYLALAGREQCPFVTADEKLFNAVSGAIPGVILLRDWT